VSDLLIRSKLYSAVRCIHANSGELDVADEVVTVLREKVESIPKQGQRGGGKKAKKSKPNENEVEEPGPSPTAPASKPGKKRDRAAASAEVPTPVKPRQKRTRNLSLQNAANVAMLEEDVGGDPPQSPNQSSDTNTPA